MLYNSWLQSQFENVKVNSINEFASASYVVLKAKFCSWFLSQNNVNRASTKLKYSPFHTAYRVTLKMRSSRTQRKTEMPSGDMMASSTRMVSTMPPHTTKQSKRLKSDTK